MTCYRGDERECVSRECDVSTWQARVVNEREREGESEREERAREGDGGRERKGEREGSHREERPVVFLQGRKKDELLTPRLLLKEGVPHPTQFRKCNGHLRRYVDFLVFLAD